MSSIKTFAYLSLTVIALHSVVLGGAIETLPSAQGYYSEKFSNFPTPTDQYPNWKETLCTGNPGTLPVKLRVILKYPLENIPMEIQSATLTLKAIHSNPHPSNPQSEPMEDHYYVVETFEEENKGAVTFEDAISNDVKKVSENIHVPKQIKTKGTTEIKVTQAIQEAKKAGWKSIAFRIIETDAEGNQMEFPKETAWGIVFRGNPPLTVD